MSSPLPSPHSFMSSSPRSLAELREQAEVNGADIGKYAVKTWITSANKLFEQGDYDFKLEHLENAYVHYLRGLNIVVETIKQHPDYSEARRDFLFQSLLKRIDGVMTRVENIRSQLERRFAEYTKVEASDDLNHVLQKYPSVEALHSSGSSINDRVASDTSPLSLDSLPPVPQHVPSTRKMSMPTPQPSPPVTSPGPSPTAPSAPPIPAKPKMLAPAPAPSQLSPHAQPNGYFSPPPLQIPPRSNNEFSPSMVMEPKELGDWLLKKNNPASILLLDVRPREVYNRGCIKHRWIAQVEPLVLRKDISSHRIYESLVMNPDIEQELFKRRNEFDLVVYYDQDSTSIEHASDALRYLKRAIYEVEFSTILPHVPVMLLGGFNAWKAVYGDRGVYRFSKNDKEEDATLDQKKPERPKHWLHDVVGKSSESGVMHQSVYDYFTHGGIPYTQNAVAQQYPAVQGIFANSLSGSDQQVSPSLAMPVPEPFFPNTTTPTEETIANKYPEIRPNSSQEKPSRPSLPHGVQRRTTFVDNPFHGFTATSNPMFDTPPLPPKEPITSKPPSSGPFITSPQPASHPPVRPSLPAKPPNLRIPPAGENTRFAPVSNNSFAQLGAMQIGATGLKNLGNTCFMNSILQCLSGTAPLARYFTSGMYKQSINRHNPLGTGGVVADSFADLLRIMWSEAYNFISPVSFREAIIRFAPQFAGTEQHDSQEFLTFLLDGLHEDCNMVTKKPPTPPEDAEEEERFERLPDWQASSIAWQRYLERNSSFIVSLFQGQYRSRLTCLTCHKTSTTYNTFMSLSLPIPAKNNHPSKVSLYQCLDEFVREEILDFDNAWHCPRCKKPRRASKALTLSRLPDVLLVHLKRFYYDGPFRNKLETTVDYPLRDLDLSRYIPPSMFSPEKAQEHESLKYDLYGVSNHYGSLTGGHYTACVRNGYRGEWHNFDDTRFSVCDQSKVSSRAAYNLFYVRTTVK
ncbi:uncharacterized protein BYT42DRAFT_104176 [Radiomyces spectabilis]|uniref:uncharacterized protein n=1 Tax=Radiomyces spectabilis TaxID=64574 RepID=UPI0022202EB7|nr:uncharacterized protein BYT42DRAFT_104176 [Radiomyces spectabilis]KAI8369314.1 hypothetical protein BYT42DRAFT_104176 [Radiomyces spectabilis]